MGVLKNLTLEMSFKPFTSFDPEHVETVCRKLFSQWKALADHAAMVSVMLWVSDGSEILDYRGEDARNFEWACHIGGANNREKVSSDRDPQGVSLHSTCYPYCPEPPVLTYGILKRVIRTLRETGEAILGVPVRIGATFDPGPEFARSAFKYERHEEILRGDAMGRKSFVCCYETLHQDHTPYAGFPDGIPEGTPFGTFFGRQCLYFLKDMGYDYLWLSNGFGFGTETWGTTGAIFDGEAFYPEKMKETRDRIMAFWKLFREACPEIRVETRGTNLSMGIDMATDAVPLAEIYRAGLNILPPPNSPWAAIDGDYGLELMGHMSRIAELPENDYLYRLYIHDPWWLNSPWIDRYEGMPHDIYLPLAVSRMNAAGRVETPSFVSLLTVDDSYGDMPDRVPLEVTPHLVKALEQKPDAPSPLLWIYPFQEYSVIPDENHPEVARPFAEDWFIRNAINEGAPVSTVISTAQWMEGIRCTPESFRGLVLLTPVPAAGSDMEAALLEAWEMGFQILLYGNTRHASARLLEAMGLVQAAELAGDFNMQSQLTGDCFEAGQPSATLIHRPLLCGGGIGSEPVKEREGVLQLATATQGTETRAVSVAATHPNGNGGKLVWIRGTNACSFQKGQHLLQPDAPQTAFPAGALLRHTLDAFGIRIRYQKRTPESRSPVTMIHRHQGAWIFSGYVPDTTVGIRMKMPLGAPVFNGWETWLDHGESTWQMPRAWTGECRVFVEQETSGMISCREACSENVHIRRRMQVTGLKNATVRFAVTEDEAERIGVLHNSRHPHLVGDAIAPRIVRRAGVVYIELEKITGQLMFSWKK